MDPQPPIINPSIPFLGYIFGGLSGGRMVIIQGRVQPQAKRFTVALRCVGDDVALQLKCSFVGGPMLVCTARRGGLWGSEERCAVPRLSPGGALELIISTQEHGYQVGPPAVGAQTPPPMGAQTSRPPAMGAHTPIYGCSDAQTPRYGCPDPQTPMVAVNGQHTLEFLHRLPLASVQALEVTGDVTLTCVTFTSPVSTPRPSPPARSCRCRGASAARSGDTPPTLLSPQPNTPVIVSNPVSMG
ncbi:galectin-5-like [Morphnus guianensis]